MKTRTHIHPALRWLYCRGSRGQFQAAQTANKWMSTDNNSHEWTEKENANIKTQTSSFKTIAASYSSAFLVCVLFRSISTDFFTAYGKKEKRIVTRWRSKNPILKRGLRERQSWTLRRSSARSSFPSTLLFDSAGESFRCQETVHQWTLQISFCYFFASQDAFAAFVLPGLNFCLCESCFSWLRFLFFFFAFSLLNRSLLRAQTISSIVSTGANMVAKLAHDEARISSARLTVSFLFSSPSWTGFSIFFVPIDAQKWWQRQLLSRLYWWLCSGLQRW